MMSQLGLLHDIYTSFILEIWIVMFTFLVPSFGFIFASWITVILGFIDSKRKLFAEQSDFYQATIGGHTENLVAGNLNLVCGIAKLWGSCGLAGRSTNARFCAEVICRGSCLFALVSCFSLRRFSFLTGLVCAMVEQVFHANSWLVLIAIFSVILLCLTSAY